MNFFVFFSCTLILGDHEKKSIVQKARQNCKKKTRVEVALLLHIE